MVCKGLKIKRLSRHQFRYVRFYGFFILLRRSPGGNGKVFTLKFLGPSSKSCFCLGFFWFVFFLIFLFFGVGSSNGLSHVNTFSEKPSSHQSLATQVNHTRAVEITRFVVGVTRSW